MRQWLPRLSLYCVLLLFLLFGCGGETSSQDQTNADGSSVMDGTQRGSVDAPAGRPSRGKIVFLQCRSCHTLKKGEAHLTGPNLQGMFGSIAGKKEGYVFSAALAESTIVWSADTLDAWLQEPRGYIPGNKMAFAGVPDEQNRVALIDFLQQETR